MIAHLAAIQAGDAFETHSTLRWLDAPPAWVVGLVLLPALAAIVWWTYRRETSLARWQRASLVLLRCAGLLAILLASFRPALEITKSLRLRTEIHFLVDDSASMGRQEVYPPEDAERLAAALGGQVDPSSLRRIDLVSRLLAGGPDAAARALGPGKILLEKLAADYDFRWFRFWDRPYPVAALDELRATGPATRIGDSLDLHLAAYAEQRLGAIVLVTDGRNTEGLDPMDSVARLRAADVPLHVLGVGVAGSDRNLTLSGPPGPQTVLRNEEAVFELTLTQEGIAGERFTVIARGRRSGEPGEPLTLDEASGTTPPAGESRKVKLRYRFPEPGDWILTFEVPPLPGETNPRDNRTTRYLRVESDRIRVLYVEDRPRWEYRYLQNALKRVDKSIVVQCWLCDASPNFPQEASEGLPPLRSLPRSKEELFRYHVVLIGDVPPWRFGATEEERSAWFELLKEFVEHGGGVGFIAGSQAMPDAYRETTIEDLLPVVLGELGDGELPGSETNEPFVPVLENPHAPPQIVRLHDDPDTNRELWNRGLAAMHWYYPVLRAKAGSTILLRHPRDRNKYGYRVLAAIAPYPRGTVFFSAFDETWRWRKPYGEKYQDRYWRNVVRALAEAKLRRGDDRVTLIVDREHVDVGQRVRVELHLLDDDFNPVLDQTARIHVRLPGGDLQPLVASRLEGRPGRFAAFLPLERPGVYSILYYEAQDPKRRPLARRDVFARIPRKEMARTSLDREGLARLAAAAGGTYAPLAEADRLLEAFGDRPSGLKAVERKTREIWDRSWTVLLIVLLLGAEWALRKRWRLV